MYIYMYVCMYVCMYSRWLEIGVVGACSTANKMLTFYQGHRDAATQSIYIYIL